MNELLSILLNFIKPLIKIVAPLAGVVSLILGAIKNPEGFVNTFLVKMIDLIAGVFPSTPENIKIASIINSVGDQIPLVGKAVIYDIFEVIVVIVSLSLIVKIYKLIPFKAT